MLGPILIPQEAIAFFSRKLKRRRLRLGSHQLFLLASLACLLLWLSPMPALSLVSGYGTTELSTGHGNERLIFHAQGLHWFFYHTSGNQFLYQVSRDGIHWSEPVLVWNNAPPGSVSLTRDRDGLYVHCVRATNDGVIYRLGRLNSNGLIEWGSDQWVWTGGRAFPNVQGWGSPDIKLDPDGNPWISWGVFSGPWAGHAFVSKGILKNGQWTNAPGFPYNWWASGVSSGIFFQPESGSGGWPSGLFRTALVPLTSGKIYLLISARDWFYAIQRSFAKLTFIEGYLWDGSAWSGPELIGPETTELPPDFPSEFTSRTWGKTPELWYYWTKVWDKEHGTGRFSAVGIGDEVHLIYAKSGKIWYAKRGPSGWSDPRPIGRDYEAVESRGEMAISIGPPGELWLFYRADDGELALFKYYLGSGNLMRSADRLGKGEMCNPSSYYEPYDGIIGIAYLEYVWDMGFFLQYKHWEVGQATASASFTAESPPLAASIPSSSMTTAVISKSPSTVAPRTLDGNAFLAGAVIFGLAAILAWKRLR